MLRSSRISPLLSRITGDGIHTALLITSDGELLGSASLTNSNAAGTTKSKPAPSTFDSSSKPTISSSSTASTSSLSSSRPSSPPLDKESVAALIAEVTSDYHRAGQELLLMNFHPNNANTANTANHYQRRARGGRLQNSVREISSTMSPVTVGNSSTVTSVGVDQVGSVQSQAQSPSQRDQGSILSCLLLEMDMVSATYTVYACFLANHYL